MMSEQDGRPVKRWQASQPGLDAGDSKRFISWPIRAVCRRSPREAGFGVAVPYLASFRDMGRPGEGGGERRRARRGTRRSRSGGLLGMLECQGKNNDAGQASRSIEDANVGQSPEVRLLRSMMCGATGSGFQVGPIARPGHGRIGIPGRRRSFVASGFHESRQSKGRQD
jgi:hypothetical protein